MLVSKAHLCVRHAASTDETRHTIHGVHFAGVLHPEGGSPSPVTEATDGYMALRVTAPSELDAEYPAVEGFTASEEDPAAFILPLDTAAALAGKLKKADKLRKRLPILTHAALDVPYANANGAVRFVLTDLDSVDRMEAKKIEGTFPPIDQVIPGKRSEAPSFTVNLALLSRVLDAAREGGFASRDGVAARFWVTDPTSPLRIEIEHPDAGALLAVVMPMSDR